MLTAMGADGPIERSVVNVVSQRAAVHIECRRPSPTVVTCLMASAELVSLGQQGDRLRCYGKSVG